MAFFSVDFKCDTAPPEPNYVIVCQSVSCCTLWDLYCCYYDLKSDWLSAKVYFSMCAYRYLCMFDLFLRLEAALLSAGLKQYLQVFGKLL